MLVARAHERRRDDGRADTVYDNWDDEGGGFWSAVKTVNDTLKLDVDRYCADEAPPQPPGVSRTRIQR